MGDAEAKAIWIELRLIKGQVGRIEARQGIMLWALGGVIMAIVGAAIAVLSRGG